MILPQKRAPTFLGYAERSSYDGASFHRFVPGFMIQCKSTKTDGSYFGCEPNGFADEFDDRLKHSWPGVLSMANSGKASKYVSDVAVLPGSLLLFLSLLLLAYLTSLHYLAIPSKNQFFITFNACPHLNRKHSIFGEVVDNAKGQPGTNVLQRIQSVATDKKNRPVEPVVLLSTEIVVDPTLEAQEIQDKSVVTR